MTSSRINNCRCRIVVLLGIASMVASFVPSSRTIAGADSTAIEAETLELSANKNERPDEQRNKRTDERSPTVGMSAKIESLVLPGGELEARRIESTEPIVLRIANVYPHGTDFRYDLVYYGLDPGTFDLRDYLQRKDGSSTDDLPELSVEIRSVLPPGQIVPNGPRVAPTTRLGGYRLLLIIGGVLWLLGAALILLVGRGKKQPVQAEAAPTTFADYLRPIVEGAIAGTVSHHDLAELERTLLAYWRRQLRLEQTSAAESIQVLRQHEKAGPLLSELEVWLHQPPNGQVVDIQKLLQPYQDIPAEDFTLSK